MKKKVVLLLLVFCALFTITACGKKKEDKDGKDEIKFVSKIEIGKAQYIEQLKKEFIER